MAMLSVRIDAETAAALDRMIAGTGMSKSELISDAIATYGARIGIPRSERPYDKMAHLIGSIDSGGMQLSTDTGRKYSEALIKDRDERRRADRRRGSHRARR